MDQWFYVSNGQQIGPVGIDDLRRLIVEGQVGPNDLVWKEGMAQWDPAVNRPEFFEQPAPGAYQQPAYPHLGTLGYQTPQSYALRFHYAGFWLRVGATILDGLILLPVNLGLSFMLNTGVFNPRPDPGMALLDNALTILIGWLYEALQESSGYQATLGKRACGIRVTDMYGQRISFARATGRHFGKIISSIILLIGYVMAAFTQRKQALHDIMAGTLVVRNQRW